jgi:hypothetical protein
MEDTEMKWFDDYWYLVVVIILFAWVGVGFGMMLEARTMRKETLADLENRPLPIAIVNDAVIDEPEPTSTTTEPVDIEQEEVTHEQDQITKLQEDNLWCFDLKKTWEQITEPAYKQTIEDLQTELGTCQTNYAIILDTCKETNI